MDKKSITMLEMKVRSRIQGMYLQVDLHTGHESLYRACRHIKEDNKANTKYLGKPDNWPLITGKFLANLFLSLKYAVRRAWLDKRIETVRARHELAHLVMGTIFLV